MTNYTRAQADKFNKTQLVDALLEEQSKVETLSNEPLTAAQVIKQELALKSKVEDTKLSIAQIEADKLIAIKKIEQEAELSKITTLTTATKDFDSLDTKINDSKKSLQDQIKTIEAETTEKIIAFNKKADDAEKSSIDTISNIKADIASVEKGYNENIAKIRLDHSRELDNIVFENGKALKQENLDYANNAAKGLGKTLVDAEEYAKLIKIEAVNEQTINDAVKAAVGKANGMSEARFKSTTKDIEHKYELQLSTLNSSVAAKDSLIESMKSQITGLTEQVKNIPSVIKQSLEAAKADMTVNNEIGKK